MNTKIMRLVAPCLAILFIASSAVQAGLIELVATKTLGYVTLSIEGNALRLTDNTGGADPLRVFDLAGSGVTPIAQLGLVGEWNTSTILSVPLQQDPLLPSTRLDSLFGGAGLSTSGNALRELGIRDRTGVTHSIDLDLVETIGGVVPEPASIVLLGLCIPALVLCGPRRNVTAKEGSMKLR
jgi:hypothetical protein